MSEPLSQRIVSFQGDELIGVQTDEGTVYAPFNRLCDNLGLQRRGQTQRVQRHAILSAALITLIVETPGGPQQMQCLRIDALPLWLAGVQASRVKEELRDKLIRYQQEAATVLWQAFKPQILTDDIPGSHESALAITQLEHIIEQSRAMQKMAEEQIALIQRMDAAARVVKSLQGDMADVKVRLGLLEERLHPASYITEEQAATLQSAVNAIAMELTRHDPSKNHFQSIHSELHRRFKVRSYTLIRQEQYQAVLAFLDTWQAVSLGTNTPEQ